MNRMSLKGSCAMSKFKSYWGEVVSYQDMLNARHCSLFGEFPTRDAILADQDLQGAVVFDGEVWRELDLAAIQ